MSYYKISESLERKTSVMIMHTFVLLAFSSTIALLGFYHHAACFIPTTNHHPRPCVLTSKDQGPVK